MKQNTPNNCRTRISHMTKANDNPTFDMSHLEKAEYYRQKYLIASMYAAAGVSHPNVSYEVQAEACAKLVQFYEAKHKEFEEDLTLRNKSGSM